MSGCDTARANRSLRFTVVVWLLYWLAAPPLSAAQPEVAVEPAAAPRVAAISDSLRPFIDRGDLAGGVTLVAREGQLVHLDAVGYADIEAGRRMRTDTLFAIASMTKPIATVAALICCDDGRLLLDEPLAKWLPEFDRPSLDSITLRHALTHTSGLFSDQRNIGTLAQTVEGLAKQEPRFAPGTRWMYGPGVTVAGRLVEVVAGIPFDEFVADRICRPLGMADTGFRPSAEQQQRLAIVYSHNGSTNRLSPFRFDLFLGPVETRSPNPSGGLYSTAGDLFRFYQMLLGRGELEGTRILKPETVDEMRRPQTGDLEAGFVPGTAYGLGLGVVCEPEGMTAMLSPGSFGHGGMLGTQAWVDPQRETILILLIQRMGLLNADASEYRLKFQQAASAALDGSR